jgi:hypothetical protein
MPRGLLSPRLHFIYQGFTGIVRENITGQGLPQVPITVYTCNDSICDNTPLSLSDGTYNFGILDTGLYKLYFNDPARKDYIPGYTSYVDDNAGACYRILPDSVLTVTSVLDTITTRISKQNGNAPINAGFWIGQNPGQGKITIQYIPSRGSKVVFVLYKLDGKRTMEFTDHPTATGRRIIERDVSALGNGIYVLEMRTPVSVYKSKIILCW